MTTLEVAIAHAAKLGLVAVLAGLAVRGRAHLCWSFAAYLVACLLGNSLSTLWPDRFHNPTFWVLKQGAYDALKMLVALELAWRAFAAFPGGLRTVRQVLVPLVAGTTLGIALLTPTSSYRTLWEWQPAVSTAALWALTATALVVVWYHVPVHDWQRAIMLGLSTYLVVFVALLGLLERHGWALQRAVSATDTIAYVTLLWFWAWAAWKPDAAPRPAPLGGIP